MLNLKSRKIANAMNLQLAEKLLEKQFKEKKLDNGGEYQLYLLILETRGDFKSALQEYLQSRDRPLPEYRLSGTIGPDHRKQFEVELLVDGAPIAEAVGPSKKDAEQQAARLALERLRGE